MYYYAYINESNICTGVYALPSQITSDGYIAITEEQYNTQSVVGMKWNAETEEWETPVTFSCTSDEVDYKGTGVMLTTKLDNMDTTIAGKANSSDLHTHDNKDVLDGITAAKVAAWDSGTGGTGVAGENGATFTPSVSSEGVISWTNDKGLTNPTPVNIKGADGTDGTDGTDGADGTTVVVGTTTTGNAGTDASVTGSLNSDTNTLTLNFTIPKGADGESGADITASNILDKLKTVDGQNSGLDADMLDGHDTDYFATATQLAGKADADHTHTGYATASEMETLETTVNGKADANHTHDGYATTASVTALESAIAGKADANHTHTDYASASHTHSQSDITGLASALNGKADTNHTHTPSSIGAASASHTHSEYASNSHTHTSFSSAINVMGAIKSNGVQVGYNSGTDTTLGSNNCPTYVAGSYVTLNGEKVYAPNIYPRNTGTFYLGAQSNRWSGIYSKVAVNVSSDERLKEGIKDINAETCADFVNKIDVKAFNYIGEDKEQIGVIAQQIISANPDFAKYFVEQGDDGYYGVKTSDLVFPLIATVQSLQKQIDELKK